MEKRPAVIRPGQFGLEAAADSRRPMFDSHNEALLARNVPVDIVFIGDSITDMWSLDAFFISTAGLIVNRGISGDRTPFVRRRFPADVVQLRPNLAVILIGVNDTWDLDFPWDPTAFRAAAEIEEDIVSGVEAMVMAARQAGIAAAVCSILPTDVPFNGNTSIRNELIRRANRRLQDIAARLGTIYVDYHSRLTAADGITLRPDVADDGLHPHIVGYDIMADELLTTLRRHGVAELEARTAK